MLLLSVVSARALTRDGLAPQPALHFRRTSLACRPTVVTGTHAGPTQPRPPGRVTLDTGCTLQAEACRRFPKRSGTDWVGPLVDYKEVDLLRKFMTTSNKLMSRKRAGTNSQEQKALKTAVIGARFIALIPYTGP